MQHTGINVLPELLLMNNTILNDTKQDATRKLKFGFTRQFCNCYFNLSQT
jgi:hypothetical protein